MASKYPPFSVARATALELNLKSTKAYLDWHKKNNPSYLPRYPNRVYKEFVSWNDWLGTQNTFTPNQGVTYRPYWEAVKWSQKNAADHNLNTGAEWVEWCRQNRDTLLPKDIPMSPEAAYDEFKGNGWSVWLGQDVRAKLLASQVQTHLFAICSSANLATPGNYYTVVHAPMGEADLRERLQEHKDMRVYRGYKWENELSEQVGKLFSTFGKDIGEGVWFFPNLNALIFELDQILEWVTIKKTKDKVEVTMTTTYEVMFPDHMYKIKV